MSDAAAHELGHIFNMQHDDIDPTSKKLYSSLHHYTACYCLQEFAAVMVISQDVSWRVL